MSTNATGLANAQQMYDQHASGYGDLEVVAYRALHPIFRADAATRVEQYVAVQFLIHGYDPDDENNTLMFVDVLGHCLDIHAGSLTIRRQVGQLTAPDDLTDAELEVWHQQIHRLQRSNEINTMKTIRVYATDQLGVRLMDQESIATNRY